MAFPGEVWLVAAVRLLLENSTEDEDAPNDAALLLCCNRVKLPSVFSKDTDPGEGVVVGRNA